MNKQNTIKLLRECDVGIKMGIIAIDEVISHIKNEEFHDKLFSYKQEYNGLQSEIQSLLDKFRDEGKNPDFIAKSMSWMKTNIKLGINESDANVADLMTDGCNMGIKTMYKILNKFQDADCDAISISKRLIALGERQVTEMRKYL